MTGNRTEQPYTPLIYIWSTATLSALQVSASSCYLIPLKRFNENDKYLSVEVEKMDVEISARVKEMETTAESVAL